MPEMAKKKHDGGEVERGRVTEELVEWCTVAKAVGRRRALGAEVVAMWNRNKGGDLELGFLYAM